MTRRITLLLVLLLAVGCKKSDDAGEDRNVSALEGKEAADDAPDASDEDTPSGDADDTADDTPRDDDAAEDDVRADDAADADSEDTPEPAIQSEITLESTGSEPRRTLTFDLDRVKPRKYLTRTDVDTIVRVPGVSDTQTMIIPRTIQTFELQEVERHGEYITATIESSEARYESRDKDDPMHQLILESMKEADALDDIRFSFDVDAYGNTRNQKVLSAGASSEDLENIVAGQLDQITSGFPTEAVGKGARWTSTNDIDVGGELALKVVVQYELVAIDDKSAEIKLTYNIDDLSEVLVDGHNDNAKLESGSMEGEGTLKVSFDQIIPQVDQSITLKMVVLDGEQKVDSTLKMRMEIVPED